jgi:hypothetical protein
MVEQRPGKTGDQAMEQLQKDVERAQSRRENYRRAVANFQRTLLLDPTNNEVRISLGDALLLNENADDREHGKEVMAQIVASGDPKWGPMAQRHLDSSDQMAERALAGHRREQDFIDQLGLERMIAANPFDWEARLKLGVLLTTADRGFGRSRAEELFQEVVASGSDYLASRARHLLPTNCSPAIAARVQYAAGVRLMQSDSVGDRERAVRLLSQVTNGPYEDLAELAHRLLPPPGTRLADYRPKPIETTSWGQYTPLLVGVAPQLTVAGGVPFDLWAASGSTLYHHVMQSNRFQAVDLTPPLPASTPITALHFGGGSVWVGTDGSGLLQLSREGAFVRRIGTNEGLPSLFLRSVACLGQRVWTGFAKGAQTDKGGFGYYDLETQHFVSLTSAALMESGGEQADGPPAHAVKLIKAVSDATLWT